jgi:D-alanyl-D-alanine carboxypeptidase
MNLETQKLGLAQSYFLNESGLDESATQSGGYGSADDVAKLMQYILVNKPEILEPTKYASLTVTSLSNTYVAKNTDILADTIPGLLASKTGYTDLAGGNLAVAFDASIGRPFIIVVLGSTESGRFSDMQTLVNATMKYATSTGN